MSHVKGKGHCHSCIIRPQSIFADLSLEQLDYIKDFKTSVYTYEPGEIIYNENNRTQYAYTLRQGLVKQTKGLEDGRTQILNLVKTGGLFGFEGFAGSAYNSTATALLETEVCRLPLTELQKMRAEHPEIDRSIMQRWLEYIRESENMLVELGAKKAPEKLCSFLRRWCSNPSQGDSEWTDLPLSRTEIGELLGITIETVSRFLAEWKRLGLIAEHKGKIRLLDPDGLQQHIHK